MFKEKYTKIFEDYNEGKTMLPFKTAEFSFKINKKENTSYRLFTTGDTSLFYRNKTEAKHFLFYRSINDALDNIHNKKEQFCLNFSSKAKERYVKRAYKKILWNPLEYSCEAHLPRIPLNWTFGIFASAKDLKISDDGFLRINLYVKLKKGGAGRFSGTHPADLTYTIDFPKGTYDYKKLAKEITFENTEIANVAYSIEGKEYSGEVYLEHPFFVGDNKNFLAPFAINPSNSSEFDWSGMHLSRKEWPEFEVKLNGKVIFNGETFEKCHVSSEWEANIDPSLLKEENTLTYKLISSYHDPLPYTIKEVGIIENEDNDITIIGNTQNAPLNETANILIKVKKPNSKVIVTSLSDALSGDKTYTFKEAGLHGIKLDCKKAATNASFKLQCNDCEILGTIPRIVIKDCDNVITGTGDLVYIMQEKQAMENYLCWYISNNIGNMLTIRPTYRWSGTRIFNKESFTPFLRVLNELDIKYVLMVDGREIPYNSQPDLDTLKGEHFIGVQNHEKDGAHYYWGIGSGNSVPSLPALQYGDLVSLNYHEDSVHCNPIIGGKRTYYPNKGPKYYESINHDLSKAKENSCLCLHDDMYGYIDRHTGPSIMFKYFAEAGYKFLGAETLYSSTEPLLAFLRGTAKAYKMPTFGVHHAIQWSSSPHDDEGHYKRLRLALYISYMLGATDNNIEEGLWRMESYYSHAHRFTKELKDHMKQQQDFHNFVTSHTRSGSFYTPFAFLHGRNDGYPLIEQNNTWGFFVPQTEADESWRVLKEFWPKSVVPSTIYAHDFTEKRPLGYFSNTPLGNADAIPIESSKELYNDYKLLIFGGYNTYSKEDEEKLLNYLNNGGKIILTRAHLTTTTDYECIRNGELEFTDSALSFTNGLPEFIEDTYNGEPVLVCKNALDGKVLEKTDNGNPLVLSYDCFGGEVILFNTKAYPRNDAIFPLYKNIVQNTAKTIADDLPIWASSDNFTEFSCFNQDDGSKHFYFIATDWYNNENDLRTAVLKINNFNYNIEMPFGTLIKAVVNKNTAAYCTSENGEVISIKDNKITVQGVGKLDFVILKDGDKKTVTIDFTENAVNTIDF